MNKKCRRCLYFDLCGTNKVCDDYTPLSENIDINYIIEAKRREFYKEWFQYIKENNIDLF